MLLGVDPHKLHLYATALGCADQNWTNNFFTSCKWMYRMGVAQKAPEYITIALIWLLRHKARRRRS